jgi:outer membrane immunogenic protein
MYTFLKILVGVSALAVTASAINAADLPVKAPRQMVAPAFNWSGFYIGGHVGYGWGDVDVVTGPVAATALGGVAATRLTGYDVDGIIGGGQIGWNWQPVGSPFVFGIEADISASGMDGSGRVPAAVGTVPVGTVFSTDVDWLATVTGRLGFAFNTWLLYVKGGWAYMDREHRFATPAGAVGTVSDDRSGWTVGVGGEWSLASWGMGPNWSAKLEYNYLNFDDRDLTFATTGIAAGVANYDQEIHLVKLGINYRFGGTGFGR